MLSGSPFSFSKSSGEWLWKRWPAALLSVGVERVAFELAALALLVLGQDLRLGRREHAVEAAQHGHRQHDALVLRRAIGTAQQVGDLPDQVREVVVVRHRPAQSPCETVSRVALAQMDLAERAAVILRGYGADSRLCYRQSYRRQLKSSSEWQRFIRFDSAGGAGFRRSFSL